MIISKQLDHFCQTLGPIQRFIVALSGGLDSTVLLHLVNDYSKSRSIPIKAIHINHQLQSNASAWAKHCETVCSDLNIAFDCIQVDIATVSGESVEALAREARYEALAGCLQNQEALLTAHHQSDQSETLLMQLFRGAGVKGLSAMPTVKSFSNGYLFRPLLAVTRNEILAFAESKKLSWIQDPSNDDSSFDRNFIRQEILPRLTQRWPSLHQTLNRSAGLCAKAADCLDELAELDFQTCQGNYNTALSISALSSLSAERQLNVLRYRIHKAGYNLPNKKRLETILTDVMNARVDSDPLVTWPGVLVRRYRDDLFILPQRSPNLIGELEVNALRAPLEIRVRKTGHKKRFQSLGVPPWLREQWPLIYLADDLVSIAGLWLSPHTPRPLRQHLQSVQFYCFDLDTHFRIR